MTLKTPKGWSLLPRTIRFKDKDHPVWPSNGKGFLKDNGDGSYLSVFAWGDEQALTFTVNHSGRELNDEEVAAVIREFTGSQASVSAESHSSSPVPVYTVRT